MRNSDEGPMAVEVPAVKAVEVSGRRFPRDPELRSSGWSGAEQPIEPESR